MPGGAVEGAALVDGAVAIDDEVSACTLGLRPPPKADAGAGRCAGGEVNHEASADRHGGSAGDKAVADVGSGEPVPVVDGEGTHLELSGRMRRHGVEMATVALPPE